MRTWYAGLAIALVSLPSVHAQDGPIDWAKSPPWPSAMRSCATYPYTGWGNTGRLASNLGCSTNSCYCRSDLIQKAHDYIKKSVTDSCGADSSTDVEYALAIYNNYCSANGFSIPGYTYVSTSTVKPTTASVAGTSKGSTTTTGSPGGSGSGSGSGPSGAGPATVTIIGAGATTTVVSSSSCPRPQPWDLTHLLYLIPSIPIKLILALPDMIVVPYTPPVPEPGGSSVFTTILSPLSAAVTEIVFRTQSSSTYTKTTEAPAAGATSHDEPSRKGGSELTSLEKAGIIIGILVGLVTTTATVWMCVRGQRRIFIPGNR